MLNAGTPQITAGLSSHDAEKKLDIAGCSAPLPVGQPQAARVGAPRCSPSEPSAEAFAPSAGGARFGGKRGILLVFARGVVQL